MGERPRLATGGLVVVWVNVLIFAAVGTAAVVAGLLIEQSWPERNTWGGAALKVFVV
jgi:hypothetical protein